MPYPHTVLYAINRTLTHFGLANAGSLLHNYITNGKESCTHLGSKLLLEITGDEMGENGIYVQGKTCNIRSITSVRGRFINVMLSGEPSIPCNHVFNMFVWDGYVLIIQVYLDQCVPLFVRHTLQSLEKNFNRLQSGNGVQITKAYQNLFGAVIPPTFRIDDFHITYYD